jgi:4-amino-4-deoxy-L-arabinose transferase-like glycosyltransferase
MSGPASAVASTRRSKFWPILLLILLAALTVRISYVVFEKRDEPMIGDQLFYNAEANRLGNGEGYLEPFDPNPPPLIGTDPAADHPPLTVTVLGPVSAVTDESPVAHRVTMALLGVVVVLLVALLARDIAGDIAGWIAAGIAAIYPYLWVNDGLVMSETLAALTVTAALILAYRLLRRPALVTAATLGALCGLAALTRAELLLLAPLLAIPAAMVAPAARRRRLWLAVLSAAVTLVVIAPWVIFNLIRFEEPTFLSTNDGIALLGSNCDAVYYGAGIGLTDLKCLGPNPPGDQSVDSRLYRERATDYIEDHIPRVVIVAAARVGRTWSVFRPTDMIDYNEGEGRERWVTTLGLIAYYPILIAAIGGVVVLWRRHVAWWPLLVPVVIVTVASALTYGQTRFRVPAEPSLVTLAAVGVTALITRRWSPRPQPASAEQTVPAE